MSVSLCVEKQLLRLSIRYRAGNPLLKVILKGAFFPLRAIPTQKVAKMRIEKLHCKGTYSQ